MIPFDETTFPESLIAGATAGGPEFPITVILKRNGVEFRIANTQNQHHAFEAAPVVRSELAFEQLVSFVVARNGSARGFRFRDWADYSTASDDVSDPSSGSTSGVVLFEDGQYRLYKRYNDGNGYSYDRRISKPRASGFILKSSGSVVASGYTLDASTGIITFSGGTPPSLSWCGYFDVPVHFASSSAEEVIGISYDDFRTSGVSISLEEMQIFDGELDWETDTPEWPVENGAGGSGGGPTGGGPTGGGGGDGGGGGQSPEEEIITLDSCEEFYALTTGSSFSFVGDIDGEAINVTCPYDSGVGYHRGFQSGGPYDGWQLGIGCSAGPGINGYVTTVTFTPAPPGTCIGWQLTIPDIVLAGGGTMTAFSYGACGGSPPAETMTGSFS